MVGIAVCEANAVFREGVEVGRGHVFAAVDADVAVAEVIGEDKDDVGTAGRFLGVTKRRENTCYDKEQGGT
jgi:hypothetical protein